MVELSEAAKQLQDPEIYHDAKQECDIVMKGGITSGVIYPLTTCELAQTYRLRNVGGTSAGGIAAAAAAAAEHGRGADGGGFAEMAKLPVWLGQQHEGSKRTRLFKLFQPNKKTRKLFNLLAAVLIRRNAAAKAVAVLGRLVLAAVNRYYFWFIPLLGAPGAVLVLLANPSRAVLWRSAVLAATGLILLALFLFARSRFAKPGQDVVDASMSILFLAIVVLWFLARLGVFLGSSVSMRQLLINAIDMGICVLGVGLGALMSTMKSAAKAIPNNYYGLTTGYVEGASPKALTEWLMVELNRYAGKPLVDPQGLPSPLTFEDLWKGPGNRVSEDPRCDPPSDHRVDLQMFSTCLSEGRPYVLPYLFDLPDDPRHALFFKRSEFLDFFPEDIVTWLERHPPTFDEDAKAREWALLCEVLAEDGLRPLPETAHIPVILATRMTLSFPLLISAVPLRRIDWSLKSNSEAWTAWSQWRKGSVKPQGKPAAERCWFSDGGISSNFPIHLFDSPFPRRPTFGISLRPFHSDFEEQDEEEKNIYLPKRNYQGVLAWWTRWDDKADPGRLGGFIRAIADTMQNWRDNVQIGIPGYRDRVVQVSHTEEQGGMNLDMPTDVITRLVHRGQVAGARLLNDYTTPPNSERTTSWENHRWVRYRSSLAMFERLLTGIGQAYACRQAYDGKTYEEISEGSYDPPSHKHRNERQQKASRELLKILGEWGNKRQEIVSEDPKSSFGRGAPSQRSEFRITPLL